MITDFLKCLPLKVEVFIHVLNNAASVVKTFWYKQLCNKLSNIEINCDLVSNIFKMSKKYLLNLNI